MAQHFKRFSEGRLDDALILRTLGIGPGLTVVDGGCGNGYMAMLFRDAVGTAGTVYAVDVNEQYIGELRAENQSGNLIPLVADMVEGTTLPDGCADVVYMSTVLHLFSPEQLGRLASEVRRLLVPGGLFGVVEFDKRADWFGPPLSHRHTPEELRAALPFTPVTMAYVADYFYLQVFRA
jgi:ubiquinone/menaquinone biosynthesis C-methylase UbiE